jgi:hypothetical protein
LQREQVPQSIYAFLRACLKPSRLEHALEAHADHEH